MGLFLTPSFIFRIHLFLLTLTFLGLHSYILTGWLFPAPPELSVPRSLASHLREAFPAQFGNSPLCGADLI